MLKLCQNKHVVFLNYFWLSTSPIVVSNQQMLSLFLRQKYYYHLKMLTICTPLDQIALSP